MQSPLWCCKGCTDAVELDQTAIILFEGAEPAIIACDKHLRRLVLAIELLEAFETAGRMTVPPLVEVAFASRILIDPARRS